MYYKFAKLKQLMKISKVYCTFKFINDIDPKEKKKVQL